MQKQYSVTINAPIQKAFAAVSEKEKVERWMEGRIKYVFQDDSAFQNPKALHNPVGTKFHESILGLLELDGEIIAFEPPKVLGLGMEVAGLKGSIFYRLDAIDSKKTKLAFNLEIFDPTATKKNLLRTFNPLFEQLIKTHLKGLKKIGEE